MMMMMMMMMIMVLLIMMMMINKDACDSQNHYHSDTDDTVYDVKKRANNGDHSKKCQPCSDRKYNRITKE